MKLSEVVKAINVFDRAKAATSYGQHTFATQTLPLLPRETQKRIGQEVVDEAKKFLEESTKHLEELGIEAGPDVRPEDYRIHSQKRISDE